MRNNIVPRPEQNMDESEGDKQINSDENPNLKEKTQEFCTQCSEESKEMIENSQGNIMWACCEKCNDWIHGICAKISDDELNKTDKFYCLKCKQKSSDTLVSTKKSKSSYKANIDTKNCQINVDPEKTKAMSKSCNKSNSENEQKSKPGSNDKVKLNSNNIVIPSSNDKNNQIPSNKITPSSCKENNQNEIDKITTNACHKTITSPVDMIKNISDEISQTSTIQSLNDE